MNAYLFILGGTIIAVVGVIVNDPILLLSGMTLMLVAFLYGLYGKKT